MTLSSLEIIGYRGFQTRQKLVLAQPNGKEGGGLTILTGANNSGKSSILECLRAKSGSRPISFTAGARNLQVDEVEIVYKQGETHETIRSVSKGSSETKKDGRIETKVFVLPSRRAFNPYFSKIIWSRDDYVDNSPLPAQRASTLNHFESRLLNILNDPDEFNGLVGKVLGFSPHWTIDQSDQGSYFLKFFNGDHSHSSDGMGEGIVSIFSIVDALYDSGDGDLIVIDEPELSLHPSLQKRLCALLLEFSARRQIVISTHSPYFVSLEALSAGATLARVNTGADGTKVHQLSPDAITAISKLAQGNLNNPHVLGLDARELFFQEDGIILTEGQEDVLLYPVVAGQLDRELPGSLFGWGAGGAHNIQHLCKILEDLGFDKIAALLDYDKVEVASDLRTKFPRFFFGTIPANDVRTKKARKASSEVTGLLNGDLVLRPEYVNEIEKLLDELTVHMRKS